MSPALGIVLKGTILLAVAGLAASLGSRRSSASLRHALWALGLGGLLLLPVAELWSPKVELPILPVSETALLTPVREHPPARETLQSEPAFRTDTTVVPDRELEPSPVWDEETAVSERSAAWAGLAAIGWETWGAMLWLLGAVLVWTRLAAGAWSVRRLVRRSVRCDSPEWNALLLHLRSALGIEWPVRLRIGDRGVTPMTWGVLAPSILLPADAWTWSRERRHLVIAHELGHIRRYDGLVQILAQIVLGLYWFHPLVWHAVGRLGVEREVACDDHVLGLGVAAEDYASHLVDVTRSIQTPVSTVTMTMVGNSRLETRLLSILDPKTGRGLVSRLRASALLLVASVLTLSAGAVRLTAIPAPDVELSFIEAAPSVAWGPVSTPDASPPSGAPASGELETGEAESDPSTILMAAASDAVAPAVLPKPIGDDAMVSALLPEVPSGPPETDEAPDSGAARVPASFVPASFVLVGPTRELASAPPVPDPAPGTTVGGLGVAPNLRWIPFDVPGVTVGTLAGTQADDAFVNLFDARADEFAHFRPYVLILFNQSPRAVTALTLRWTVTDAAGRDTAFYTSSAAEIFDPPAQPVVSAYGQAALMPSGHMSRFNAVLGARYQTFPDPLQMSTFARAARVTVSLDALVFEDGEVWGPDRSRTAESLAARSEAVRTVLRLSTTVRGNEIALVELLRPAAGEARWSPTAGRWQAQLRAAANHPDPEVFWPAEIARVFRNYTSRAGVPGVLAMLSLWRDLPNMFLGSR